jgi:hypothetical protein
MQIIKDSQNNRLVSTFTLEVKNVNFGQSNLSDYEEKIETIDVYSNAQPIPIQIDIKYTKIGNVTILQIPQFTIPVNASDTVNIGIPSNIRPQIQSYIFSYGATTPLVPTSAGNVYLTIGPGGGFLNVYGGTNAWPVGPIAFYANSFSLIL